MTFAVFLNYNLVNLSRIYLLGYAVCCTMSISLIKFHCKKIAKNATLFNFF